MFSPYYHWAGRRQPKNHVCLNVALYGPNRWAMTERGAASLERTAETLRIGPSAMHWDGRRLTVRIDERAVPRMTPIRGQVVVTPEALTTTELRLDPAGLHLWRPFAPRARIDVALDAPRLAWQGEGYLDGNFGARPLEADFRRWNWSRAPLPDGAAVLYEAEMRDGSTRSRALRFDRDGAARDFRPPPKASLGRGFWRVQRETRSDGPARVLRRMEDAPFYTRELIAARLCGAEVEAVHETLDLDRFRSPVTKLMLPFRMPRRR